MIEVVRADPRHPEAAALLRESHALMTRLFPPEDNFHLDIDELCAPEIRFFTALRAGRVCGTAALVPAGDQGEIKSMFVAKSARGTGVADALMARIESEAGDLGLKVLKLETGDLLHEARALYRRHGFSQCGPFGGYGASGSSVFMEKRL